MTRRKLRSNKAGQSRKIGGVDVRVAIDLSDMMGPQDFDEAMRGISEVVERSASLSLDSAKDRELLKKRLQFAFGAIEG